MRLVNKSLRILIVDGAHSQRLAVEKIVNQCGYYRIAPVESFEQLLTYTQYALHPFDVVILNSDIAIHSGVDIYEFCIAEPNIVNFLIYNLVPENEQGFDIKCFNTSAMHSKDLNKDILKFLMSAVELNFYSSGRSLLSASG